MVVLTQSSRVSPFECFLSEQEGPRICKSSFSSNFFYPVIPLQAFDITTTLPLTETHCLFQRLVCSGFPFFVEHHVIISLKAWPHLISNCLHSPRQFIFSLNLKWSRCYWLMEVMESDGSAALEIVEVLDSSPGIYQERCM